MRKATTLLMVFGLLVSVSTVDASATHVKASLKAVDDSGVHGSVELQQLKKGGTSISVNAKGLNQGTVYASFYYDDTECTVGPELIGTFTGRRKGAGHVSDRADEDLDAIGSVSVRIGPDYGTLLACAATK